MKPKVKWQDWTNLVAGLWVFVSPWVLQKSVTAAAEASGGAASGANWNLWIVGLGVAAVALIALFAFQVWEEWVNLALGVWLLASPWILGFSSAALLTWNAVILGVIIAVIAGWALTPKGEEKQHSG